jgi:outer membrane protein assembly factor BamB
MRVPAFWLLAGCLCLAGCGGDGVTSPAPSPSPGKGDWPMYGHDPSRSGANPPESVIDAANLGALAPRFQARLGMGELPSSSGPVLAEGRVCAGSSVPRGKNYFCFDALTGEPLWGADIGHPPASSRSVGVGSTAAISDGRLFVGGGDAAYYALAADSGRILWRHPMQVGSDAFAWSSPLVANGLVYVGISAEFRAERGELRGLAVEDGSLRARRYFVPFGQLGADIWNSAALSPDGGRVVVVTGNDFGGFDGPFTRSVIVLEPNSLAIQASHQEAIKNQDLDFGTTPVFFRDSQGRTLVGANQKNGTFYAYDLDHVSDGPAWKRATGLSVGTPPAYDATLGPGGTLFVVGDNGVLYGLDPANGSDRWPPAVVGFANGNIAVANGLVFMGSGAGRVTVVEASTGMLLRTLVPVTPGPTYAGVIVAGGMVYWVSGEYLNAWGLP